MAICIGAVFSLVFHICTVAAAQFKSSSFDGIYQFGDSMAVAGNLSCSFHGIYQYGDCCSFDAIYQFGDSMADAGNQLIEAPKGFNLVVARLPHGITFFRRPTGRASDGFLMIDYIALALGLPFLNPYLKRDADFTAGVNFAVGGASALNASYLANQNLYIPATNSSLFVQLEWFRTHLKSICFTKTECKHKLKNALFLVGAFGLNDYTIALINGKTMEEVMNLVPPVIERIKDAVKVLIDHGATRLIVPGNIPIGCFPYYLARFMSNDSKAYDGHGCLKGYNNFVMIHNKKLKQTLQELREEYVDINIVYADHYAAYMWVLTHASELGFDVGSIQEACCGGGGRYNYNVTKDCADEGVRACPYPKKRLHWDGCHLTMMGNMFMASWVFRETMAKIQC